MDPDFQPAIVTEIIQESPRVKRYLFQPERRIHFEPGQFVMLDLPIESKFTNRSYSIASEPREDGLIELCIVLNPEGAGTPYLWDRVHVGDVVPMSRALGKFTFPEQRPKLVYFICTGTGIAPFRSMIRHMDRLGISLDGMTLVFGNRVEEDILYRTEWADLEKRHPGFRMIPVLSRPQAGWKGASGYVHAQYMAEVKPGMDALFYLCGWATMVKEARNNLRTLGYDKSAIKLELYD